MAVEVERILADEVAREVDKAVHRVAGADADPALVVVDAHDRAGEEFARHGVPRRGERWVQRQLMVRDLDAGDEAHLLETTLNARAAAGKRLGRVDRLARTFYHKPEESGL